MEGTCRSEEIPDTGCGEQANNIEILGGITLIPKNCVRWKHLTSRKGGNT
jgi:hypothetical protein